MAFGAVSGYGNLPSGNFSSVIYSKKVQLAFRKSTVAGDITNSDYFGEIANQGDTVRIIKEPEISVSAYLRGTTIAPQDLSDDDFSLVVDKANYFAFKVDDIEEAHSHVNFMDLATNRAAYRLADSIPVAARLPGATALPTEYVSPTMLVARMGRLLDQQSVDKAGRWVVIDPVMMEILMDEDSRFLNSDFGDAGALRNGLVINNWNGFRVYVSNNLPSVGTGPATTGTANQNTNYGAIVAGHDSAVATAEQINKTETYRDPDSFADIVRGMHLYGRKILRPEALVTAKYNLA